MSDGKFTANVNSLDNSRNGFIQEVFEKVAGKKGTLKIFVEDFAKEGKKELVLDKELTIGKDLITGAC